MALRTIPRRARRNFAIVALALVFLLSAGSAAAKNGNLQVGTCMSDITPISPGLATAYEAQFGPPAVANHTDPIFLAGFGNDRRATGYNDRLWARAIVLDGRGGRVALVALDLVGYFVNEVEIIRGMLSPDAGIDYLIVHSTHQHEGPDTLGLWGPDELTTGIDYGYLDFVNASVAECVEQAAANLQQARVKFATTDSVGLSLGLDAEDDGFGVADGKVLAGDELLAPATGGRIVDPRLAIMQLTGRGHPFEVLATLVNFGSHPESMGSSNTLVTSDFPHYVRERLEQEYGGMAIWVSGDLGVLQGPLDIDVLDPDTGLPAPRRTFRFAEVHGTQLAERAISAINTKKPGHPAPEISFATESPVVIPLDNPYFRFFIAIGVLNTGRTLFTGGVADPTVGFPFPPPFDVIPQALGEDLHTEVGGLRIGDGSFAIVPGELDPQIGELYRAQMAGAEHTFIVGLGNDEIGYQLPADKWDDSCHTCFPFVLGGVPQLCPVQPIDCNTVFINNIGAEVDPAVSGALMPLLDELH
jgi:hypothetical protein